MYEARLEKAARLKSLLPQAPPAALHELPLELYLFDDAQVSVVYAPVDFVNTEARIVLIGLTPSWQQAQAAMAAHAELSGKSEEEAGFEIKRRTAFAGSMRQNLITMLVTTLYANQQGDPIVREAADILCQQLRRKVTGGRTPDRYYKQVTDLGRRIAAGEGDAAGSLGLGAITPPPILERYV